MSFGVSTEARTATNYGVVTPSNTASYPDEVAGLWVGGAGTVTLVKRNGDTVLISGVPAGCFLPFAHVRVNATGTSATLLVWYT